MTCVVRKKENSNFVIYLFNAIVLILVYLYELTLNLNLVESICTINILAESNMSTMSVSFDSNLVS